MELNKTIKNRKSVRKFSSKKPDWRDILECIDSMRYIPIAGGNYTLKLILIKDKEKIKKIAKLSEQDFIAETKYLLVVCSNPKRLINSFDEKGKIYSRQQAGAGIQNFLLKITELNLSTCWIGHFDEKKIKKLLKIPEGIDIEAVFPIGFEYEKKRTIKEKIPLDNILYFDEYENKKMKF